jgi:Ca-activated chloride channel homolog
MKTVSISSSLARLTAAFACSLALSSAWAQSTPSTPPQPAQTQSQPQGQTQTQNQPQPAPATGQAPGGPQFTLTTSVNEVDLVFTVTDHHGRFVKDLQEHDFALLDDQRAPAQVLSFAQQTKLPLRLGVLVDTSTSIRERFDFEKQAVNAFLLQILRPSTDEAFIEGFDVVPDYKQNWTNNLDLLSSGVANLHSGGGTALFDAVYSACRDKLLDTARGQEAVRKAIVLVSDGDDNQSHAYLTDAIKECQRADTSIYAISTNVSPSRDRGDDVLQKMADETGGRALYPNSIDDLPNSFASIQEELRSQYALVYKPADFKTDGAFRSIYLYCLDHRYTVHTRKGYFAPKA